MPGKLGQIIGMTMYQNQLSHECKVTTMCNHLVHNHQTDPSLTINWTS